MSKTTAAAAATPPTEERLRRFALAQSNQRISAAAAARLQKLARADAAEVDARLRALEHEWPLDRTLMLNAGALALGGVVLGATVARGWLALSAVVLAFLIQHAVQGFCPPLPVFRAYGWRSDGEIADEATALRLLHGRAPWAGAVPKERREEVVAAMVRSVMEGGYFLKGREAAAAAEQ